MIFHLFVNNILRDNRKQHQQYVTAAKAAGLSWPVGRKWWRWRDCLRVGGF